MANIQSLRPYQQAARDSIHAQWEQGRLRTLLVLPTGTGKTCAFGIPVAEHIDPEKKYPQAVIMAPTRELAQQIAEELTELTYFMPEVQVACVYGGANMEKQARRLAEGCQIVVATPGRLMDHYSTTASIWPM